MCYYLNAHFQGQRLNLFSSRERAVEIRGSGKNVEKLIKTLGQKDCMGIDCLEVLDV